MKARLDVAASSHPGRRASNDDWFCIARQVEQSQTCALDFSVSDADFHQHGLLCAVADGMGGYEGGALAARTALQGLSSLFYARPRAGIGAEELAHHLERDLEQTGHILGETLRRAGTLQAGTTLAGLVLRPPDVAIVFHCGDSRVLRASAGYVRALTLDHAPLAAQIASGHLLEAGAAASPLASKVNRSLGLEGVTRVEIQSDLNWEIGDLWLLCSDGFHGLGRGLSRAQLREHLLRSSSDSLQERARSLVEAAVAADGHDNVTLVAVAITS